jgi:hypothetical protein
MHLNAKFQNAIGIPSAPEKHFIFYFQQVIPSVVGLELSVARQASGIPYVSP